MAQSKLLTVALTSDDETKTTAYSMGIGLVSIEQFIFRTVVGRQLVAWPSLTSYQAGSLNIGFLQWSGCL